MPINQIQVPQQQSRVQEKEESVLDKILKGVQIANALTSTYSNIKDAGLKSTEQELKARELDLLPASKGFVKSNLLPQGATESPVDSQQPPTNSSLLPATQSDISPLAPAQPKNVKIGEENYTYTNPEEKKQKLDIALNLAKQYRDEPTTKATQVMASAANRAFSSEPTAAGDMALIYAVMKANDPNSSVREGEYATAANSGKVGDAILNIYNRVRTGEKLQPEQREQFRSQLKTMFSSQLENQAITDSNYIDQGSRLGIDKKDLGIIDMSKFSSNLGKSKKQIQIEEEMAKRGMR